MICQGVSQRVVFSLSTWLGANSPSDGGVCVYPDYNEESKIALRSLHESRCH